MAITDRPPLRDLNQNHIIDVPLTPRTHAVVERVQKENVATHISGESSRRVSYLPELGAIVYPEEGASFKRGSDKRIYKAVLIVGDEMQEVALASPHNRFMLRSLSEEQEYLCENAPHLAEKKVFEAFGKERYIERFYPDGSFLEFKRKENRSEDFIERALRYFLATSKDLKYRFHDHELRHGDISLANVMLDGKNAQLIDFSTVKKAGSDTSLKKDIAQLADILRFTVLRRQFPNVSKVNDLYCEMKGKAENRPTIEEVISSTEEIMAELEATTKGQS